MLIFLHAQKSFWKLKNFRLQNVSISISSYATWRRLHGVLKTFETAAYKLSS